jgi:hypothetical protein
MSVSEKQKGSSFTHPEEAGYHVTAANEDITHDAVFGDLDGNGPNFRAVSIDMHIEGSGGHAGCHLVEHVV